jgi:hypothetical protein
MRIASKIVAGSALLVALVCCSCAMAQESLDSRQLNFQLLAAARAGDAAAVERLVHAGASVKTRNRVGATPLLEAARGVDECGLACAIDEIDLRATLDQ